VTESVAIIGGGPSGLAAAATLAPLGLNVRVVERDDSIGARWRRHYERLHLHTTRQLSSLPGLEIPADFGKWVARDDFAHYLELYAEHHRIPVELGTRALAVEHAGRGYRVETSRGAIDARYVVVAAGAHNTAYVPDWPGRDRFAGRIVHSKDYRNAEPYARQRVIVAGTGNSGAEIATELAEHGADVAWSIRTPPTIVPRDVFGLASQGVGIVLRPLPPRLVDPVIKVYARLVVGDLAPFGLAAPSRGAYTRAREEHVLPVLDVGIVAAVKARRVRVVPAIAAFDDTDVVLTDGSHVAADAVIACTGYRTDLESLVGGLRVLDARGLPLAGGGRDHVRAPGVYFIGYNPGVSGGLREIALDALHLADRLAHDVRART
jgi:putative flavoprotein involved in K+ transport